MKNKHYVIVGGGIAGITAAKTIRENDPCGVITVLSNEADMPYARPMLTKAALLSLETKKLSLYDENWYSEQKIELLRGVTAQELDTVNKTVRCDHGLLRYDKCILATGAKNFIPPFTGLEDVSAYGVRTMEDVRAIRKKARAGKGAVVIGGGVIGLEMAVELTRYGMNCVVLEAMPHLMPRLITRDISDWIKQQIPEVPVCTGVSIKQLRQEKGITIVEEQDGRTWKCELLIIACGVRANIELAKNAGIACDRAVVVNAQMKTSADDVYACGDCTQFQGFNAALWSQGQVQGTVAGKNAAGTFSSYQGCDTSLILNLPGTSLFALGELGQNRDAVLTEDVKLAGKDTFFVQSKHVAKDSWGRKVWENGQLVGIALMGDLSEMHRWKSELLQTEAKE